MKLDTILGHRMIFQSSVNLDFQVAILLCLLPQHLATNQTTPSSPVVPFQILPKSCMRFCSKALGTKHQERSATALLNSKNPFAEIKFESPARSVIVVLPNKIVKAWEMLVVHRGTKHPPKKKHVNESWGNVVLHQKASAAIQLRAHCIAKVTIDCAVKNPNAKENSIVRVSYRSVPKACGKEMGCHAKTQLGFVTKVHAMVQFVPKLV